MGIVKNLTLAAALGATALTAVSPAMARDYYGWHHHHGDKTATAIGVGVLGLAIGAIAASAANDHGDRYYRRPYYNGGYYDGAYNNGGGWYYRDGYYWDRDGRRYDRDAWNRYQRGYDSRSGYGRDYYYYRRGY